MVGASFGRVAAALAVALEGNVSVALIEPSQWVGGQATVRGVSRWDEANIHLIETVDSSKSYRELRNAIRGYYSGNASLSAFGQQQQYFNPGLRSRAPRGM